jgi:hypothetical protein
LFEWEKIEQRGKIPVVSQTNTGKTKRDIKSWYLILVAILISEQNLLGILVHTRLLQILIIKTHHAFKRKSTGTKKNKQLPKTLFNPHFILIRLEPGSDPEGIKN